MKLQDTRQHDEFWFEDGSIVLQVENVLFRVHKTILSNHSEVFADIFTIPQPLGQDAIEGCQIIQMHDGIDDVIDLLHAIYRPSHFDKLARDADVDTVVTFISGILRLSTKYAIQSLRQRCINLLSLKFPTSFYEYNVKASIPTPERYKSDSVMRAITLAQDNNVPMILPYAYYCVARMGSRRVLKQKPGDISWKDKAICLAGRERLRWAELSLSHSFLLAFQRSPSCPSNLCAYARGPHAEWHLLEVAKSPNPLRQYLRWAHMNVCSECVSNAQAQHLSGRTEVWDRLPYFFELPGWEELKTMQSR